MTEAGRQGDLDPVLVRWGDLDEVGGPEWKDLDLLVRVARAHSIAGNATKVERFYSRCAELHPSRAALYHAQTGWFFQRAKRWARAISWYDHALATFPDYHLALFRRGYCLERLHRPREAAANLEAADHAWAGANPAQRERSLGIQSQVLFHLARNLREIGETTRAREILERCERLETRPDSAIKREHLLASAAATHLRDGDAERAIALLTEARRLDPSSAAILERLGLALETSGREAEAEMVLLEAVAMPKGSVALLGLSRFLLARGRHVEAASSLQRALERHPRGEVQIRIELANLHRALGRPVTALEILDRLGAGRVPPHSSLAVEVHRTMAEIAWAHGDRATALARLRNALDHDPTDARARVLLQEVEGSPDVPRREPVDQPLPGEIAATLAARATRANGRIANYIADRGFGFITPDGSNRSIFFHVSHVPEDSIEELQAGRAVTYIVVENPLTGKRQAEELALTFPAEHDRVDPADERPEA